MKLETVVKHIDDLKEKNYRTLSDVPEQVSIDMEYLCTDITGQAYDKTDTYMVSKDKFDIYGYEHLEDHHCYAYTKLQDDLRSDSKSNYYIWKYYIAFECKNTYIIYVYTCDECS